MGKGPKPRGGHDPRAVKQQERKARAQFAKSRQKRLYGDASWKAAWNKFSMQMAGYKLMIKDVAGDGNCLFRAIADQLEGMPEKHATYRKRIVDFIRENSEDYAPFIEDDQSLDAYLNTMSQNATWGGHLEIHAASMIFRVNICIHQLDQPRWEMRNHDGNGIKMIHLSYHDGDHYASVRRMDEPANHSGPPLPINLEPGVPFSGSQSSSSAGSGKKKDYTPSNWEHDFITSSTGCQNVNFIEEVLNQCNRDPNQAVDFIFSTGSAEDIEFQREFLLNAGVDPGDFGFGFGDVSEVFEDPHQGEEESFDWKKHNKGNKGHGLGGKKGAAAAQHSSSSSSSSSSSAGYVHPKLAKFQNQHVPNKKRQQQEREARASQASTPTPASPAAATPTPTATGASEPLPDLGSLSI